VNTPWGKRVAPSLSEALAKLKCRDPLKGHPNAVLIDRHGEEPNSTAAVASAWLHMKGVNPLARKMAPSTKTSSSANVRIPPTGRESAGQII